MPFNVMPLNWPLATVYGNLMHHRAQWNALGEATHQPPYIAPPRAPVLYIKPANTFSAFGASIATPVAQGKLRARACVGLFLRQKQSSPDINTARSATDFIACEVAGVSLLCDFTLAHESFHRPPVKFNAFDGSLGLPGHSIEASLLDLQHLQIETWVNGFAVHRYSSADWLCAALEQFQTVSEFIAFEAGDVLMMGCPPDAPLVSAADVVEVRMNGHIFTRNMIIEAKA